MHKCIPLWSKWLTRQSKWCCTTWKKPAQTLTCAYYIHSNEPLRHSPWWCQGHFQIEFPFYDELESFYWYLRPTVYNLQFPGNEKVTLNVQLQTTNLVKEPHLLLKSSSLLSYVYDWVSWSRILKIALHLSVVCLQNHLHPDKLVVYEVKELLLWPPKQLVQKTWPNSIKKVSNY